MKIPDCYVGKNELDRAKIILDRADREQFLAQVLANHDGCIKFSKSLIDRQAGHALALKTAEVEARKAALEEAAKAVESYTAYLAVHGFNRFPQDDIRALAALDREKKGLKRT